MADSGDDRIGKTIAPASFVFHPMDRPGKRRTVSFGVDDADDSDSRESECPSAAKQAKNTPVFPPQQPAISRNVFMTSPPGQSANSSDSESDDPKPGGFRLKPATLIAGRSNEAESVVKIRSVLRPATLLPPASQPTPSADKQLPGSLLKPATLHPPAFLGPVASLPEGSASEKASRDTGETTQGDAEETGGRGETPGDKGGDTVETPVDKGDTGETKGEDGETPGDAETTGEKVAVIPSGTSADIPGHPEDRKDPSSQELGRSSEDDSGTNYFLQCLPQPAWGARPKTEGDLSSRETTFVFGQNMNERVVSPVRGDEAERDRGGDSVSADGDAETETRGRRGDSSPPQGSPDKGVSPCLRTLEESAAAYTEATSRRCLLETVETRTGEEAESNVLQVQCKLFVFDKLSQAWVERGRGSLRLNDMASSDDGSLQSRLVMRTQGSLRLILNTKLWAHMQLDKASERGLRVTAWDGDENRVRVFLITASLKDTGQLFSALHHRILALRNRDTETDADTGAEERKLSAL